MMEKRATVERIKGWYRKCGAKPCRNDWFREEYDTETLWCCPLGAWYLSEGGDARRFAAISAANDYFGLGNAYICKHSVNALERQIATFSAGHGISGLLGSVLCCGKANLLRRNPTVCPR